MGIFPGARPGPHREHTAKAQTVTVWRMRKGVALIAATVALVLAACGGGGDGDDGSRLADRILRLGEDLTTMVDVRSAEFPVGMSEALNPGLTDDTPQEDIVALPVHSGELIGSFRIVEPDGVISFYLLYDIRLDDRAVNEALMRQLDESPWQVVAGQSTETQSAIRFQSTVSGDIEGRAFIRPIADPDGPLTSVVYILQVRPPKLTEAPDFQLPAPRPVPDDFPAPFLVLEGMTPITVQWSSSPVGDSYQLVLLTLESAFDVAAEYRERFEAEGWELTDDRAIGFATVLDFQSGDGATQGNLSADSFADDDSYTSVVLDLLVSARASDN